MKLYLGIVFVLSLSACSSIYPDPIGVDDFLLVAKDSNCGKTLEEIMRDTPALKDAKISHKPSFIYLTKWHYKYEGGLEITFKDNKLVSVSYHWLSLPYRARALAYAELKPLDCLASSQAE